eukprot:CAMPEP_0175047126 /NCGR_PEP_ID=MMETSP0052_2-20121109/5415_1 /TAXON_ID=51329 ORGANISM="Polytomella parva, Strain SAG 63-3" /NCGR_SAMPLE_ID=MMETSP0052_2 /ASSEMBLY_ACC=CAM_ASM_000194 /LENGTH=108 /DNA_ID=CAMNT_0016310953 /DNA_START=167 /DNA_END=493 /DNA_ORIENTATION=-
MGLGLGIQLEQLHLGIPQRHSPRRRRSAAAAAAMIQPPPVLQVLQIRHGVGVELGAGGDEIQNPLSVPFRKQPEQRPAGQLPEPPRNRSGKDARDVGDEHGVTRTTSA